MHRRRRYIRLSAGIRESEVSQLLKGERERYSAKACRCCRSASLACQQDRRDRITLAEEKAHS
jgi:hypothetical protein